jgi:hypothetical protein
VKALKISFAPSRPCTEAANHHNEQNPAKIAFMQKLSGRLVLISRQEDFSGNLNAQFKWQEISPRILSVQRSAPATYTVLLEETKASIFINQLIVTVKAK